MADSISDFLTVIRNACRAKKDSCMGKILQAALEHSKDP